MSYADIRYDVDNGRATITIDRPQVLNAFTSETLAEFCDALRRVNEDLTIGVAVVTGAGDRAFCVGGDVKWEAQGGIGSLANRRDVDFHLALRRCRVPVVAAVKGYAIGGGNHLAYFCDLTIAADNAIFGQNGPVVASPADGSLVAHLVRVVGEKKAREIWYLCRRYDAHEALQLRLVNCVVPLDELDATVDAWCREILDKAPTCIELLKASFEGAVTDWQELGYYGRLLARNHDGSAEAIEGRTAFIEKRQPDFAAIRAARAAAR